MSSEKGRMFSHLQWKDRLRIEKMLKEKKSKTEIARTLRVDYTTIMREIKRGLNDHTDFKSMRPEDFPVLSSRQRSGSIRRICGPRGQTSNWGTTTSWRNT